MPPIAPVSSRFPLLVFSAILAIALGVGTARASVAPPGVVDLGVAPGVAGANGYALDGRLVVSLPNVPPNPNVARVVVRLEARDGAATITPPTVTHEHPALDTALETALDLTVPFGEVEIVALAEAFAADGRKLWGRADSVFILAGPSEARIGSSSVMDLVREELAERRDRGAMTQREFEAATQALLTDRPRVPGTASFAAAAAAPAPRGGLVATTTVQGTCRYVLRNGTNVAGPFRPIANARVRFVDDTPGGDFPIGETTTDANGQYSATVPGTRNGNAVNLVANVAPLRQVNGTTVAVVGTANRSVYFLPSNPVTVTSATTTIDLTAEQGLANRIFSVFDVLNVGFDFVRDQSTSGSGANPLANPLTFVEYPGADANGSFFNTDASGPFLNIGLNHAFDWDVLFHEYGHYTQFLNGTSVGVGGQHFIAGNQTGNNCFDLNNGVCQSPRTPLTKDEGTRLAWGEGWPTFFGTNLQIAVNAASFGEPTAGDTRYDDTANDFGYDLETNTDNDLGRGRGEDNELAVQRILWDLFDAPNDESDTLALGIDFMIGASFGPEKPITLSEFWNVILPDLPTSPGNLVANQVRAGAILGDHRVAPVPTGPADSLPIDESTPPPTFTWNTNGAGGSPNPVSAYGPSYLLNRFNVKFYDNTFGSLVFTSPEIVTNGTNATTASYTPSAANWATIVAAGTVRWTVEGRSDNPAPTTGRYLSQARTLTVEGSVPPDKGAASCAGKAAATAAKLAADVAKCHTKAAAAAFKAKAFDLGACELKATATYDGKIAGIKKCPACVAANATAVRTAVHTFLDARNGDLFCAGSTALGGGPTGFVPPDKDALACAIKLTGAGSKLGRALGKCHVKAANAAFKNKPFDLGACETAAAAKYDKTTAGVKKCPACAVSGAVGLRPAIETMQNERDGLLYCAGTEPLPG